MHLSPTTHQPIIDDPNLGTVLPAHASFGLFGISATLSVLPHAMALLTSVPSLYEPGWMLEQVAPWAPFDLKALQHLPVDKGQRLSGDLCEVSRAPTVLSRAPAGSSPRPLP